jgi:hypothetical protein
VLLQEQEQHKTKAPFRKSLCASMTCRAAVRKQLGRRFALIEILSMSHVDQHDDDRGNEETAPQLYPVPQVQTPLVISRKCGLPDPYRRQNNVLKTLERRAA